MVNQPLIEVRYHHRITEDDPVSDVPPRLLVQAGDPLGHDAPGHCFRCRTFWAVAGAQRHVSGLDGAVGRHLAQAPEAAEFLPELAVGSQVGGDLLEGDGDALERRVSRLNERGEPAVLLTVQKWEGFRGFQTGAYLGNIPVPMPDVKMRDLARKISTSHPMDG